MSNYQGLGLWNAVYKVTTLDQDLTAGLKPWSTCPFFESTMWRRSIQTAPQLVIPAKFHNLWWFFNKLWDASRDPE